MFDAVGASWQLKHSDDRLQRMAECYLASYVEKRKKREVDPGLAS